MVDANQRWGIQEAIDWMIPLAKYNVTWIEEPTSPDDILGHAKIAEVASFKTWQKMMYINFVSVTIKAVYRLQLAVCPERVRWCKQPRMNRDGRNMANVEELQRNQVRINYLSIPSNESQKCKYALRMPKFSSGLGMQTQMAKSCFVILRVTTIQHALKSLKILNLCCQ
jgi:Enolase C-terminal domain-like